MLLYLQIPKTKNDIGSSVWLEVFSHRLTDEGHKVEGASDAFKSVWHDDSMKILNCCPVLPLTAVSFLPPTLHFVFWVSYCFFFLFFFLWPSCTIPQIEAGCCYTPGPLCFRPKPICRFPPRGWDTQWKPTTATPQGETERLHSVMTTRWVSGF